MKLNVSLFINNKEKRLINYLQGESIRNYFPHIHVFFYLPRISNRLSCGHGEIKAFDAEFLTRLYIDWSKDSKCISVQILGFGFGVRVRLR